MTLRRLAFLSCTWLALATAACAAPSSQPATAPAGAQARATPAHAGEPQATEAAQDPVASPPARDLDKLRKLKVRTGGPLPPRQSPEQATLDRSCRNDADCAVRNVGDCCAPGSAAGSPACVNKDSPADPEAAKARCAQAGTGSTCASGETSGCRCVAGSCIAQMPAIDPSVDPAPLPPEQR